MISDFKVINSQYKPCLGIVGIIYSINPSKDNNTK